jgi:hypothetical protein
VFLELVSGRQKPNPLILLDVRRIGDPDWRPLATHW